MNGSLILTCVIRMAGGFAINSDDLTLTDPTNRAHPTQKALLQFLRLINTACKVASHPTMNG